MVAPELVVECVARVIHLMGGKSGSHMLLWVPTRDSVVRSWGLCLHGRDSKSYSGAHHVAPKTAAELEARSEASFICIVLVLCENSCEPPDLSG
jgi:hypothetical protein